MAGQRVPSPEEIRALVEARQAGKSPTPLVAQDPRAATGEELSVAERQMRMMKSARKSGKEVRAILDLLLEIYDVEPIEELIKIAQATKDPGLATKIWLAFNEYRLPKLKAVEHGGNVNVQHNVTIVRFGEDGQARGEDLTNRQRAIDVEVASG